MIRKKYDQEEYWLGVLKILILTLLFSEYK